MIAKTRTPWIDSGDSDEEEKDSLHCNEPVQDFDDKNIQGRKYLSDLRFMEKTSDMLQQIGWLDRKLCKQGPESMPFTPAEHLTSS